jgi:ABC-type amino acid transport system permease subunit
METATLSLVIAAAASMLLAIFTRNKWVSILLPACLPALIALAPLAGSTVTLDSANTRELAVYLLLGLLFYLLICGGFAWLGGLLRKRLFAARQARAQGERTTSGEFRPGDSESG